MDLGTQGTLVPEFNLKEREMESLDLVKNYRHPAVIRRFQKEHPEHAHRAVEIFEDLMIFFWASKAHERERVLDPKNPTLDFVFIMDEEMKPIDLMWHVFLLYTSDYTDFCEDNFGEYLHHLPDVVPAWEISERFDPEGNLRKLLNYIHERLGAETLCRWYRDSAA